MAASPEKVDSESAARTPWPIVADERLLPSWTIADVPFNRAWHSHLIGMRGAGGPPSYVTISHERRHPLGSD